ncbi:DUF6768 family protein [Aliikangiella sp. IMCC44653]
MNLDRKIEEALKLDEAEVEKILNREQGLFQQLFAIFRGKMMFWNIFGLILSVVLTGLTFWSGYHFFYSEVIQQQIFWGVLSLAFWTGLMGIKIWFWLEMQQHATIREIKRLELTVAQLNAQLKAQLKAQ